MHLKLFAPIVVLLICDCCAPATSVAAPIKLDTSAVASGSVQPGFQVTSDGNRVVYLNRTLRDMEEVFELDSVAISGGIPVRLNGALQDWGDVSAWQLSVDGNRVVYWADQETDGVNDVYAAPTIGGVPQKLSASLVDVGSTGGGFVGSNGNRVAFIASQVTGPFTGTVFELFSALSATGGTVKLNGQLVSGGDVQSLVVRPDGGRVLYLADQEKDEVVELYSASPLGGLPVKLNGTLLADRDVLPDGLQFSPNGNSVLYLADQDANDKVELYSVPTTGGTPVKLNATLPNAGDVTPGSQRYSPDGTRVLYRADQNSDEVFEIFSVPSGGGTPVRLNATLVPDGDVESEGLQFSSDSSRVLYHADQITAGVSELFSVPSAGGTPVKLNGPLAVGGDVEDDAVFSPNGSRVLYRADQATVDVVELYSVPSTGGTPIRLNFVLVPGGNVLRASFSPDGSRVVYLADQDINDVFELYTVPSLGGTPVKISGPMTVGGNVTDWQFSPDGRRVVYLADQSIDEQFELYSVAFTDELQGDFNHDGTVNAADYTTWRNGLGTTYSASDFNVWKMNFGTHAGSGSAGASPYWAVPEPGTSGLVVMGTLLGLAAIVRYPRNDHSAGD